MRIAVLSSTFPPYHGGIGNVAAALAQHLTERGHQLTVFTPSYGLRDATATPYQVVRLPAVLRYGNAAFLPQLFGRVRGYDVVHLHYPFFGGVEAVYLRAKLSGTPLVVQYHHDAVGVGFRRPIFAAHRSLFLRPLVRVARSVVVNSMDYAQSSDVGSLVRRYPSKFVAIPHGVETKVFHPGPYPTELAERLGVLGKRVILFVGSLDSAHYFKGVNYLIDAVKQLAVPNVALVVVGEGDLRYSYEEVVRSSDLSDRVIFTGAVSAAELPSYYRLATCGVLPSTDQTEAFGVVLIEAMATAKPIVASDLPGVRAVVGRHREHGLLVKPRDSQHLAAQLKLVLEDEQLARRCGQAGLQTVHERYSWPVIAAEFEAVYRQASHR